MDIKTSALFYSALALVCGISYCFGEKPSTLQIIDGDENRVAKLKRFTLTVKNDHHRDRRGAEAGSSSDPEAEATFGSEPNVASGPSSEFVSEPKAQAESESTAEGHSESEPMGNGEPNAESKATSEVKVEAVVVQGVPEPEGNAKAEAGGKPEPEGNAKAEAGGKPEPEGNAKAEAGGKPEPEGNAKAEAGGKPEPEGNAKAEAGGKPEPEGNAKAEAGGEPEAEGNAKAEAGGKPEPEGNAKAEAGGKPEPEGNAKAEAGGEPEAEGNAKAEARGEPEAEGNAEGETGAEPETEERPQPYEIIMPPLSLMIIILAGLGILALWTQRMFHMKWFHSIIARLVDKQSVHTLEETPNSDAVTDERINFGFTDGFQENGISTIDVSQQTLQSRDKGADDEKPDVVEKDLEFFTDFDLEVLGSLGSFNNRPLALVRVASPALISLALCPMTLYLYEPLVTFFWPPDKFSFPPDINEAIACFLAPAGLVYATSFGFAFQQALTKQQSILAKMTHELGLLDQIVTITTKLNLPLLSYQMAIYKAVKAETIFLTLQVMNTATDSFQNNPTEDITIRIWSVLDELRNISHDPNAAFDLDAILVNKIVSHVLELNSICSDRMGTLHARIHPLKWAFLESLGFFSFFGILLLQAQSYRTELVMCIMTVFSISLLCYVVSDLDSPFCGFFKIDLSALPEVVMRTRKVYELAKRGHNVLCTYPNKANTGYDD